jgi:hypothetical protein
MKNNGQDEKETIWRQSEKQKKWRWEKLYWPNKKVMRKNGTKKKEMYQHGWQVRWKMTYASTE